MILVFHILMDRIVREARECKPATGNKNLNLVGGREFSDAVEDFPGLVLG
jgi:hypothetical protein